MVQAGIWKPTTTSILLGDHNVHLWRIKLDQPLEIVHHLGAFLSQDEQGVATRFQFEDLRRRYIVARGCLRTILASYTHLLPRDLVFEYAPHGKPFLVNEQGPSPISFNLAHSHGLALAAVTLQRRIGVDLEYQRPLVDAGQIASRYFSREEYEVFRRIEPETQLAAFYACWTRKEAFVKAIGEGLSYPLDRFSVAFAPGESARILNIAGDLLAATRWSMHSFNPGNGYTAALAVEGIDLHLSCCQWSNSLIG